MPSSITIRQRPADADKSNKTGPSHRKRRSTISNNKDECRTPPVMIIPFGAALVSFDIAPIRASSPLGDIVNSASLLKTPDCEGQVAPRPAAAAALWIARSDLDECLMWS
eukprot:3218902-Pyramimonas_sp.AAC.1